MSYRRKNVACRNGGGLNNYDKKPATDRRKEKFKAEWLETLSTIRNIASQINDFRPSWISPEIPKYWQVDQFLHAYYYNKVKQTNNTYPFEEYYQSNKSNPQGALIEMLQWWKSQPTPPSDEDHTFDVSAPAICKAFAKDKILNLNVDEFCTVLSSTHATRDHVIKLSTAKLGRPDVKSLTRGERLPLLADMLYQKQNKKGQSILELMYYVLYGGKADLMWERIYEAGKLPDYQFGHYGINSIAEVVGWALPEITPPINGRTNKALRALGYPVNVYM